jgi:hypothetical protein
MDSVKRQTLEGLRPATKLTQNHIDYRNNIMNVKLAMQVLSGSASNALIFMSNLPDDDIKNEFAGCVPTAELGLQFNHMADLLNCKNKFSKTKYGRPLDETNYGELKTYANNFEDYIKNLRNLNGVPILKTNRKTGFLGIIICLRNMFAVFDRIKHLGQTYLLPYKLLQDNLETFFGAVRARGGFNNNPNALQFKLAYKRLLVRHEIKEVESGNCLFEPIEILHVSSARQNLKCPIGDPAALDKMKFDFAHDYISSFFALTPYVEHVVNYIAGYVANKI